MKLYQRAARFFLNLLSILVGLGLQARHSLHYKMALAELYKPRPDDIFIVTYPKSGTTLIQMMLYQMTSDGSMDIPHILSVSPWFEHEVMTQPPNRELFESLPSPRFFKTHFFYDQLPQQGRFIYIVRDVRDVALSSYHHFCLMTGVDQNREQFINGFLRQPRSWFKFQASWWPHRNDENVLFLTYEGIIKDLEGTVRKLAAFCGIPVDESSMPRIVERCSIGFMKQHWEKFDPRLRRISRTPAEFVRKGVAGTGRNELTPGQEARISRELQELAAKVGLVPGEPHNELFK